MARIIDGKAISAAVRADIADDTRKFIAATGKAPGLAVIIVGDDGASKIYVRNKRRACTEVGFYSEAYELPADTKKDELISLIEKLNTDEKIHGILLQLPLPEALREYEDEILETISANKDVDAFHPYNVGKIMQGAPRFLPCTPAGVIELLDRSGIDINGRDCVVVGRSNIVGKPMAMLLLARNGTVTIAHSRTKDLREVCKRADIIVCAVGRAKFLTADMVKDGAVVIDVGINRDNDGRLCGDVDYEAVSQKAAYITPVPGGVGPMTITMLMKNTLTSAVYAEKYRQTV